MTRENFNNLVIGISGRLYSYAYRILRSQHSAEDAVQEVFLKLWRMNTELGKYNSVEALAVTMLKNYCIDQIRKSKYETTEDTETRVQLISSGPTPYDEIEKAESSLALEMIIDDLPELYRKIVFYREIEELSYEEISEKTGQNINSLRVNLSRARKIIKEKYNSYFNDHRRNKTTA